MKQVLILNDNCHGQELAEWSCFDASVKNDNFHRDVKEIDEVVQRVDVVILFDEAEEHDHTDDGCSDESISWLKLLTEWIQNNVGNDNHRVGNECTPNKVYKELVEEHKHFALELVVTDLDIKRPQKGELLFFSGGILFRLVLALIFIFLFIFFHNDIFQINYNF